KREPDGFTLIPYSPLFRSSRHGGEASIFACVGAQVHDRRSCAACGRRQTLRNSAAAYIRSEPRDGLCYWQYYVYRPAKVINCERSEEHTSELQSRENLVCS